MLNLISRNINMKPDLKILNVYIKPCIETVHLGENWLNNKQPKIAQVAKCRQILSHCLRTLLWMQLEVHSQCEFYTSSIIVRFCGQNQMF
jgi:hypothetical protein